MCHAICYGLTRTDRQTAMPLICVEVVLTMDECAEEPPHEEAMRELDRRILS